MVTYPALVHRVSVLIPLIRQLGIGLEVRCEERRGCRSRYSNQIGPSIKIAYDSSACAQVSSSARMTVTLLI